MKKPYPCDGKVMGGIFTGLFKKKSGSATKYAAIVQRQRAVALN